MASVTERIGQIKQPYSGYLKLSEFEKLQRDDGVTLNAAENISGALVGLAVDYLTRLYFTGGDRMKVLSISLRGAVAAKMLFGFTDAVDVFKELIVRVTSFYDNESIANVCRLAAFDVYYRNPIAAANSEGYALVNPDSATIRNIRTLTERSISFFNDYGPVTAIDFTFEPSGYTETVNTGDGDFLTANTLWDMKVYRSRLTSKHTLQILMYWIMGKHSEQEIFRNITKIGLYNPRSNTAYILDTERIPEEVIKVVEDEVICY